MKAFGGAVQGSFQGLVAQGQVNMQNASRAT